MISAGSEAVYLGGPHITAGFWGPPPIAQWGRDPAVARPLLLGLVSDPVLFRGVFFFLNFILFPFLAQGRSTGPRKRKFLSSSRGVPPLPPHTPQMGLCLPFRQTHRAPTALETAIQAAPNPSNFKMQMTPRKWRAGQRDVSSADSGPARSSGGQQPHLRGADRGSQASGHCPRGRAVLDPRPRAPSPRPRPLGAIRVSPCGHARAARTSSTATEFAARQKTAIPPPPPAVQGRVPLTEEPGHRAHSSP